MKYLDHVTERSIALVFGKATARPCEYKSSFHANNSMYRFYNSLDLLRLQSFYTTAVWIYLGFNPFGVRKIITTNTSWVTAVNN